VTQLVEALRYKPEGRGFDSRLCHWNYSLTQSFLPHYGPGVDSASNRNEYIKKYADSGTRTNVVCFRRLLLALELRVLCLLTIRTKCPVDTSILSSKAS